MHDSGIFPAQRLWTPWRMPYVGGNSANDGCVFCKAANGEDDVASLIVYRGDHAFVMLNLFPYNTGHLMIVPVNHLSDPSALSAEARAEIAELTASFCTGLQFVMGCDGLNTGMNLGSAAGAGIADHVHQHVVPRWSGDANFMPIIGGTKVLPELLPVTYGKVRAEVARQRSGTETAGMILFSTDLDTLWLEGDGLPETALTNDTPVWKTMMAKVKPFASASTLLGWGGASSTTEDAQATPVLAATFMPLAGSELPYARVLVTVALNRLPESTSADVQRIVERFAREM